MSRRDASKPRGRGARTLVRWLAARLGCPESEAEERLLKSRRVAWRLMATPEEAAEGESVEALAAGAGR